MIFVDCGALYALVVADDPRHVEIEKWFNANEQPLLTTDYCIDELLTLLVARKRPALAVATGWKLFNEEICRLVFLQPDQIRRAWAVFQGNHRLGWSFTDCTSKVVMNDLRIRTAAALDQHFRQFGTVTVVP
jgi:predicted nucleic acid-binding protein